MSLQANSDPVHAAITQVIDEHAVVLFMKGEPSAPECRFSATVVKIPDYLGIDFVGVDVLKNPAIRAGVKGFSDWPTVPQLYVRGEFVGGADIVRVPTLAADRLQPVLRYAVASDSDCAYGSTTSVMKRALALLSAFSQARISA